jgi:hypothetical protein
MSQKNQGNKQSEREGADEGSDRGQPKTIKSEEKVGSSGSHGVRFDIPNHPDKSVVRPGGA